MKPLCIYHKNCADGLGAALAIYTCPEFGAETEFRSAQYGDPAPDVTGRDVVIVDFSYPRETLETMRQQATCLLVIDHHKTAQDALAGLEYCIFDMSQSGAMLAWMHFHPNRPIPKLIQHIQDRDLWQWQLPGSREISAALNLYPMRLDVWADFLNDNEIPRLQLEGETILRYQRQLVDRAVYQWTQNPQYLRLDGVDVPVPVTNTTTLISEIGESLCAYHSVAATYFDTTTGQRVYSLRRRAGCNSPDVSAIAKRYGGGGHPAAAGFSVPAAQSLPMYNRAGETP